MSLRASIGPTTDFDRGVGFEAIGGMGVGFPTGARSAASFSVNAGGGMFPATPAARDQGESAPPGCFVDQLGIDHIWMPKGPDIIYRAGARGGFRAVFDGGPPDQKDEQGGGTTVGSVGGAIALLPLVSGSTSDGIFDGAWAGVGPEVEVDYVVGPNGVERPHGRLALTVEFDTLVNDW